ncbi:branched-chain alpha-keto acid dehydrogenase subunit E2 [Arthrobacter pityocampae]|uniref:Dihydrolipoamide acetyltransferase component of pyruvate dehydrogenase complex n=1 Tax=Arthrobacter pityocampae TaxID=547334 RepID=A0A2S5IWW2_9MICC|nr:dihydrolipoamide acetyltransferase family protein [Arthrobacter pityocampae]PPB49066.1 branched-chain alpha-keto acid dehydrogenase subunit E2 [Arthrobacter pityocampae]
MSAPAVESGLQVFALPDLGEGLTEAELVSWLVAEGDTVAVDQPIAEVETAKSVVEVPSPFAGTVAVLHGRPGQVLDVGAPFLSVRPEGGEAAGTAPAGAGQESAEPEGAGPTADSAGGSGIDAGIAAAAAELREEAGVPAAATGGSPTAGGGSGNVLIGYGTPGGLAGGRTRPRKGAVPVPAASAPAPTTATRTTAAPTTPAAAPASPAATSGAQATATDGGAAPVATAGTSAPSAAAPTCVSPLVRKLARDNGVRLADLHGSGEQGLILRRDVEQAIAAASSSDLEAPADVIPGATPGIAAATLDPRSGLAVLERTPLRGVRRTIADAMTRSRREIPEATVWVDVDATALVDLREEMKRRTPDAVPGLLAFVARFVVAGLDRYPELNSRIVTGDDGVQELVRVDGVNLGIAAQTDRGLVVPSVRRADTLSARGLDAEIRRLAALAREGKATPSDLASGTFTLNNYGVFGVDGSAAIINYPESAILGMGRIIDRPWVVDGRLAVRKVTELTLAFDHRVCDGGTAGGFLRFVADAIENPGGMLADL